MRKHRKPSADSPRRPPVEPLAVGLSLLAVGLLLVLLVRPGDSDTSGGTPATVNAAVTAQAVIAPGTPAHDHGSGDPKTLYACPMMCTPPVETPGRCPVCGMTLTPVHRDVQAADSGPPRLQLSAEAVHLAEIRTAPVMRMPVTADVRLFGRIDYDSAHITDITAFMPGVIDRVYVKRAGQFVRWGDPLFDIYSSDLLETQTQLVEAMQYVPSFLAFQAGTPHVARDMPVQARQNRSIGERTAAQGEALKQIAALRHKLSILGLPKRDIDQFMKKGEATGIATVYAPMYGQITVQNATEGAFVNTGTSLFTIADPKYVWARLDAYESDYPWIRRGQTVTFTTEAYPGETFDAKVVYIDPVFDSRTRTFSIGAISTMDQGGRLKAGMMVRAVVHARLDADGHIAGESTPPDKLPLVIPATAPMITGRRAVVYVSVSGDVPTFEGREVALGPRARNHYVVRDGLAEGEQVVVNGNFKIDSAMQISARPSMMVPAGGMSMPMDGHMHMADGDHHAHAGAPMTPMPVDADEMESMPPETAALAQGMNDQYMQDRRRSRMEMDDEPHHDRYEMDHGESRSHGYVSRRKPGHYGDTTRQGASNKRGGGYGRRSP